MDRLEGIQTVFEGPSHIVILGAGASIASTIHNPEPNGKKLPSMDNFIEVVGLATMMDTGERFMHQFLPSTPEEALQESNKVPQDFDTLEETWEWHRPLIEAENNAPAT